MRRMLIALVCFALLGCNYSGGGGGSSASKTTSTTSGSPALQNWDYDKYPVGRAPGIYLDQKRLEQGINRIAATAARIGKEAEKEARWAAADFGYLREQIQSSSGGGQQGGTR